MIPVDEFIQFNTVLLGIESLGTLINKRKNEDIVRRFFRNHRKSVDYNCKEASSRGNGLNQSVSERNS